MSLLFYAMNLFYLFYLFIVVAGTDSSYICDSSPHRPPRVAAGDAARRARGDRRASVEHLPVCYRYFDCFDSFSGWYGMVVFTSGIDSLIVFADLIV